MQIKKMGLCVDKGKTKYMAAASRLSNIDSIRVDNCQLEKDNDFKYLVVNISNKKNMHVQINERVKSRNTCYFSIIKLLRSKLLSRKLKTLLYHNYI